MSNKKSAIIISFYRWWEIRQKYFANWLEEHGYCVKYYTADFDHISKQYGAGEKLPSIGSYVHVPAYKSNISISRIVSNVIFAKKIYDVLKNEKPDVIICLIPSNLLGITIKKIKLILPSSKIIIDVLDMWPESLPLNSVKRKLKPIMDIWKKMREEGLNSADKVLYECNLFKVNIEQNISITNSDVLYLQKGKRHNISIYPIGNEINFAYIGSINSIIDIDRMINFVTNVKKYKKVKLTIIGCGDHEEYFLSVAKQNGINVDFRGPVFDKDEKHKILNKCHFGLNIMKTNLKIGLTTKSMEYLYEGLPLINNITMDTYELVNKYHAGLNLNIIDDEISAKYVGLLDEQEYQEMVWNAKKLFDENFSEEIFKSNIDSIMEDLLVS